MSLGTLSFAAAVRALLVMCWPSYRKADYLVGPGH